MSPEQVARRTSSKPHPQRGNGSLTGMGVPRRDLLMALALGSRRETTERRLLPDRRSGLDRRKISSTIPIERRSGIERRRTARRRVDRDEGASLLQKARTRLTRFAGSANQEDDLGDGLR